MLFDHVALRVIQLKVAVGIAQGRSGVPKPVQPVRGVGRVPIVEEIIVQQSAAHKSALVHFEVQPMHKPQAHKRHAHGVLKHAHRPVLHVLFCNLHTRGFQNITAVQKQRAQSGAHQFAPPAGNSALIFASTSTSAGQNTTSSISPGVIQRKS